jgi:hypothetical protein
MATFFSVSPITGKKWWQFWTANPQKVLGHFEENKFSVGGHQFLLECCPKLIKTYNFGQNNKSQFINKKEPFCALGFYFQSCFSKTFCQFSICYCRYFLLWRVPFNEIFINLAMQGRATSLFSGIECNSGRKESPACTHAWGQRSGFVHHKTFSSKLPWKQKPSSLMLAFFKKAEIWN